MFEKAETPEDKKVPDSLMNLVGDHRGFLRVIYAPDFHRIFKKL
jgi:hypothetical protein